jgi:hypothetical protein
MIGVGILIVHYTIIIFIQSFISFFYPVALVLTNIIRFFFQYIIAILSWRYDILFP